MKTKKVTVVKETEVEVYSRNCGHLTDYEREEFRNAWYLLRGYFEGKNLSDDLKASIALCHKYLNQWTRRML